MDLTKLCNYVRWAVFELACKSEMYHSGESYHKRIKNECKLTTLVEKLESADKAIELVCKDLQEDKQFNVYNNKYSIDRVNCNNEYDEDNLTELELSFFTYVIEFIGLFEIKYLMYIHYDAFINKFFALYDE